jgi:hypothetical protein
VSHDVSQCVHIASGADSLTELCSPPSFPAITRAAAVHTPTQSDHFMFFFHEITDNFVEFFCCCSLVIGSPKSVSSLRRSADKYLAFPISYLQQNEKNFSWMG